MKISSIRCCGGKDGGGGSHEISEEIRSGGRI